MGGAQTGLKAGTPVVMGGGDGLCSNVGGPLHQPGPDVQLCGLLRLGSHHQ